MAGETTHRAFISYSHVDKDAFTAVRAALADLGIQPWSDNDLAAGKGFTEGIQIDIAHAHIFVPILTPQSHKRGWVHQEIGFAVAMKVPCVPVCIGKLPEGMIAMAHAITLDNQLDGLREKLAHANLPQLVREAGRHWIPPIGCADEPEVRAQIIAELSEQAHSRFAGMCVRIRAGLGSFTLPRESSTHDVWIARYGNNPRTSNAYSLFQQEREALERHASSGGLKMTLNPNVDVDALYGAGAKHTRLSILVHFLQSLNLADDAVSIAFAPRQPADHVLAVGDWYIAEALDRPVRGVKQTVFIAHAPTVTRKIADFDREHQALLAQQPHPPGKSKHWAVQQLLKMMETLPRHPAWAGYDIRR